MLFLLHFRGHSKHNLGSRARVSRCHSPAWLLPSYPRHSYLPHPFSRLLPRCSFMPVQRSRLPLIRLVLISRQKRSRIDTVSSRLPLLSSPTIMEFSEQTTRLPLPFLVGRKAL